MDAERSLRFWKLTAIVAILAAVGLFALVIVAVAIPIRFARLRDDRLIGTWLSDADRTIAGMQPEQPKDSKREAKLREIFGKMRVTYTAATYTTELNGEFVTYKYQLLGRDEHSVVISETENKPSPLEFMELSTFSVIHFDTPDSYWLDSEVGQMREYFKRVP
jgi:hypothetical protein